jgi:ankyrin repeat protein
MPPPPAKVGLAPFLQAASTGALDQLERLFSPAALAITDPDGKNALHFAVSENRQQAVEWLLAKGFNIESRTAKGEALRVYFTSSFCYLWCHLQASLRFTTLCLRAFAP